MRWTAHGRRLLAMWADLAVRCVTGSSLVACSAMGLDRIDLPHCENDAQCEPLNARYGLGAQSCERFQCNEGLGFCEHRLARDDDEDQDPPPRCGGMDCDETSAFRFGNPALGGEICDGVDNDCDGTIDEGYASYASPDNPLGRGTVTTEPFYTSDVVEVVYTSSAGELGAAFTDVDDKATLRLSEASSLLRYMTNSGDSLPGTLAGGCHGETSVEACSIMDLAIGLTQRWVYVAAVNGEGCAQGELRLGHVDRRVEPGDLIDRGPARASNVWRGVGPGDGACTFGTRATMDQAGVWRPSVATLDSADPNETQALVVYVGDALRAPTGRTQRTDCGGAEAPVEAIAAFVRTTTYAMEFSWVTASYEGRPEALGRTVGGGRPGIVSSAGLGYFVAHGDASGALALHYVPTATPPPTYTPFSLCTPGSDDCAGMTCVTTSMPFHCDGGPLAGTDDRTGLQTAALPAVQHLGPFPGSGVGEVDHVVLASGAIRAGAMELGVAWREGCGAAGSEEAILFRRFSLAQEGATIVVSAMEAAVRLSPAAQSGMSAVGSPAIAYAARGFAVPELARSDGRDPATEQNDGGWVVAWRDRSDGQDRILARRLSEMDGQLLDPREVIELSPGAVGRVSQVGLYAALDGGAIGFAYRDQAESSLVTGNVTCGTGM